MQIDLRVGACDISHSCCLVLPHGILEEALNMALLRVGRNDHEGRAVAMAAEAAWGQFGDRQVGLEGAKGGEYLWVGVKTREGGRGVREGVNGGVEGRARV